MRRKKKRNEKDNSERWLLTYSDLITLLMIFFVVMYSISNVNNIKFQQMAQSLSKAMGSSSGGSRAIQVVPGTSDTNKQLLTSGSAKYDTKEMVDEKTRLKDLKEKVDKYLEKTKLSSSIDTSISERGLEISLRDTILFDSGKADIKPGAKEKLIALGKIINTLPNLIRIDGHTDNDPIYHNSQFESNWELSAIRAVKVNKLLIDYANIPPTKVTVQGFGEYHPLVPNTSSLNKAKNRRVNIVILNSMYNPSKAIQK